jgi:hypothetical protein
MNENLSKTSKMILAGRPRISVDFAIILRMRDEGKMGWSRMAEAYRKISDQYISRDTIKRRYLEAKSRKPVTIVGKIHIKYTVSKQ